MANKIHFTQEIGEQIIRGIEDGLTQELACQLAGVQYQTVKNWVKYGEREDATEEMANFAKFYHRARGARALRWVKRIDAAAQQPEQWRAAAWLLETCERDHYRKHNDEPVAEREQPTPEERLARINRIINERRAV